MVLDVEIHKSPQSSADTVVVCVFAKEEFSPQASELDNEYNGLLSDTVERHDNFKGKVGQVLQVTPPKNSVYEKIFILGLGDIDKNISYDYETAGAKLYLSLKSAACEKVELHHSNADRSARIALGMKLRSYKFDKYLNRDNEEEEAAAQGPAKFILISDKADSVEDLYSNLSAQADGVYLTRDLVNEPPNVLYPESYAQRIKDELKPLGVEVEVLDDKKMEKLGMGAALAVGKGSERKPRIVVMRWNGAGNDSAPIGLVGKGVTFDTGGISIKPSNGMHEMKFDMGGSASVVGAMKTIATRKAQANVVAIVGLAENMPSHNAYRPGDIVKSMSGKTVEVLNTDAEGRLVLADCLTYIQQEYDPKCIIDLATLTGAMMVALGTEYAGAFVNDDKLWDYLNGASKKTNEKLWRMPLDKAYSKDMKATQADYNNLGAVSRYGGACTAAAFLEFFVDKDRDWAHLDIAGVTWNSRGKPLADKNSALGYWARTLDQFVADYAES